ncbi:MAG: glutaredoxin-like protein NrdH [Buchananella hordeovulneris]|nr:glutaredoxin-like protein NrdH [Buchananella hordeovulneris]
MSITVYSKPRCVQCDATYRALTKAGVEFNVVDLTEDAAALELVRELGYSQAPVVMAGDEHWAGFRPDRIKAAVTAYQAATATTLAAV